MSNRLDTGERNVSSLQDILEKHGLEDLPLPAGLSEEFYTKSGSDKKAAWYIYLMSKDLIVQMGAGESNALLRYHSDVSDMLFTIKPPANKIAALFFTFAVEFVNNKYDRDLLDSFICVMADIADYKY